MSFDKENVIRLIDEVELLGSTDDRGEPGWIYFIICADAARCKIGFTKGDPEKRLRNLQTGSASELIIIAQQPGTLETERKLHDKFAAHRLHGEWFELTDELRAYMVSVLWAMSEIVLRQGRKLEKWMVVGLAVTSENLGCVSESLANALEEVPA